jgi:anaerobic magnesium-protoporphyrin IX monomethyl ester cyclase
MKYLIVVPRIANKVGEFYQFPQGIAYISSVMAEEGFNVYKLNLNHLHLSVSEAVEKAITDNDIDVLLTGGLTGQYGAIRSVIEAAKKIKQDIIIIVGGGIITSSPLYAMQALEFADFGVIGEGEIIICELCHALESFQDIKEVPGIIYKDGLKYYLTEGEPQPVDVNKIPFPDYRGLGLDELIKNVPNIVGMSEENTFPVITSRGCPFHCTFCFHPTGQKYRQRLLDNVFAEIDYLIREYDIKYLAIQDELFDYDTERLKEFCIRIKPYNIKWWAQFRVTDITQSLVEMLKEANCTTMGFGIESSDNRILRSMNKRITIEDIDKALKIVYDAGIGIQGCLIFGDIAETIETATNSINWWKKNIHYGLQLSLVVTYPGTELFRYSCQNRLIKDPVQFIKDSCPTVKLSKMSKEEYVWMMEQILSLQRIALSLPQNIKSISIDYEQACMSLTAECNSCKTENNWSQVRFFITESISCEKCGRRHYSPIPDTIVDKISKNLIKLSKQYDKICFWGINSYFYSLCEKLNISNKKVFFVDKSDIRHGINIFVG